MQRWCGRGGSADAWFAGSIALACRIDMTIPPPSRSRSLSRIFTASSFLPCAFSLSACREDEVDEARVYPNRALGGVVAIELR
jgi:hypothetical protein